MPLGQDFSTKLDFKEEVDFLMTYARYAKRMGLNPDPDDPQHYYDYRGLWKEKKELKEDKEGHLPSKYKKKGHPTYHLKDKE